MKQKLKIIIPAIVVVIVAIVGVILVVNNNQTEQVKGTTTEVVKTTLKEDKTTTTEKVSTTENGTESTTETTTQTTNKVPSTTKKIVTNSTGNSNNNSTTTQKPSTTEFTGYVFGGDGQLTGYADPKTGLSWDGTPIVYHYPDGTTSTTPIDGAKYEYTPGIWCVIVIEDPNATTVPAGMCSRNCGRTIQQCDRRMSDWHCDVCDVDVKRFECHDRH